MSTLEQLLAVCGNSGNPTNRLVLADALEEAGDQDAAAKQRALARLLEMHGTKFATVSVVKDWWGKGSQDPYRALVVADNECYVAGRSRVRPAELEFFWSGPAGEMWMALRGRWAHGYGGILYNPANASVEHPDAMGESLEEVLEGLREYDPQKGTIVLVYLSGEPSKELYWYRWDGEGWQATGSHPDLKAIARTGHDIRPLAGWLEPKAAADGGRDSGST
jgi:hypothetical protein